MGKAFRQVGERSALKPLGQLQSRLYTLLLLVPVYSDWLATLGRLDAPRSTRAASGEAYSNPESCLRMETGRLHKIEVDQVSEGEPEPFHTVHRRVSPPR